MDAVAMHDRVHKDGANCKCPLNKALATRRKPDYSEQTTDFMYAWFAVAAGTEHGQLFGNGVWFGTGLMGLMA